MGEPLDADDVLGHAWAWLAQGRGVALATVVATWGSAPRRVGSQLVVNDAGAFFGSVSSGCIEGAVVETACEVIARGGVRRLRFGVTQERAWEVGLACGGDIEIFVERVERRETLARLLCARRARRAAAVVSDLASGEQWLYEEGAAEPAGLPSGVLTAVRTALREDRAHAFETDARALFVNVWSPPLRMIVIGAVHIAQPLVPLARLAGFAPIVIDPRSAFASAARFPDVEVVGQWPDVALAELEVDARCAIVALTHDPKLDDPALVSALRSPAFYVGALGSRRSHAKRLARLREHGFSDADLARIHGPVGLAIGAQTPAEIAVAIVAQAIEQVRRPR